jgi:hypothetical protein
VISLRRVLDDIKEHRALFTRENYVAHDGLPYDPAPVKQAYVDKIISRGSGVHGEWIDTTGPRAWSMSYKGPVRLLGYSHGDCREMVRR